MTTPALAGVFTFRVLADNDPVQITGAHAFKRALYARQYPRRPDVGVLIERLTDRQPQPPQCEVIGHVRRAHCAKQNGLEGPELISTVCGHKRAFLFVAIATPVEVRHIQLESAIAFGQRCECTQASINHFNADTITRDGRNLVGFHHQFP